MGTYIEMCNSSITELFQSKQDRNLFVSYFLDENYTLHLLLKVQVNFLSYPFLCYYSDLANYPRENHLKNHTVLKFIVFSILSATPTVVYHTLQNPPQQWNFLPLNVYELEKVDIWEQTYWTRSELTSSHSNSHQHICRNKHWYNEEK